MDPRLGKIIHRLPELFARAMAGDPGAIVQLSFWGVVATGSYFSMRKNDKDEKEV